MTTTTTTKGSGVTVDEGVRFTLNSEGRLRVFRTELEAKAARVRSGGGRIFPV